MYEIFSEYTAEIPHKPQLGFLPGYYAKFETELDETLWQELCLQAFDWLGWNVTKVSPLEMGAKHHGKGSHFSEKIKVQFQEGSIEIRSTSILSRRHFFIFSDKGRNHLSVKLFIKLFRQIETSLDPATKRQLKFTIATQNPWSGYTPPTDLPAPPPVQLRPPWKIFTTCLATMGAGALGLTLTKGYFLPLTFFLALLLPFGMGWNMGIVAGKYAFYNRRVLLHLLRISLVGTYILEFLGAYWTAQLRQPFLASFPQYIESWLNEPEGMFLWACTMILSGALSKMAIEFTQPADPVKYLPPELTKWAVYHLHHGHTSADLRELLWQVGWTHPYQQDWVLEAAKAEENRYFREYARPKGTRFLKLV